MAQITLNQPIAEIHGALSKPRPLFFAIVCSFTYGVPENARGVLGCLTNNIWVSLVLSRHLFCFCQWSGKYPCLYTLHPILYTKKSPSKAIFLAQSKLFLYLCTIFDTICNIFVHSLV